MFSTISAGMWRRSYVGYSNEELIGMASAGSDMLQPFCTRAWVFSTTIGCAGIRLGPDFSQESRVRENLTHGLMRGGWKPGMIAED